MENAKCEMQNAKLTKPFAGAKANLMAIVYRVSLNIRRAEACEKIFRQSKQKSARIVDPIRRIFVTISERSSGGKDSVKISCDEFLEVPICTSITANSVLYLVSCIGRACSACILYLFLLTRRLCHAGILTYRKHCRHQVGGH